ncbi:MAG: DUF6398 domain-containing protein [Patescibacteria group bacterium]|nr:DUF6398 domain-containing protein [Patescibacteria group bacterium]
MNLTPDEAKLFYDLYAVLLSFVNRKLEVSSAQFSDSAEYISTPPEVRLANRDALFEHRELIDEFVAENPAKLKADELEIVRTWKYALPGQFYICRYLKTYTVFLTSGGSPNKAYGVLGLIDRIEDVIGPGLPKLTMAVLLPFRGKIIYDGIISAHNIMFGGRAKRILNEEYQQVKQSFGIITSLGDGAAAAPTRKKVPKQPRKAAAVVGERSASAQSKEIVRELTEMTDAFCRECLNEEYADLCRKLVEALARKRPSPLLRGNLKTWACGIVRTIGWVNYLDDRNQKPHMKLPVIDRAFGVAESTGQGKSKTIRKMLKIREFDPRWTLPSMRDDNPRVWMLEVNGFIMDLRDAPRAVQEMAFERGLIPYIPANQAATDERARQE